MRNLETTILKPRIFYPRDSLNQALIAAVLQRQVEASALQADFNSLQMCLGLRCKPTNLALSIEASQAAAGLDLLFAPLSGYAAGALPPVYAALTDGALRTEVPRLFLLGHWRWLVAPCDVDEEQLGAGLECSLTVSSLDWTLMEVSSLLAGLCINDLSRAGDVTEVEAARVSVCAKAPLDEVRLGLHKHQYLRLTP